MKSWKQNPKWKTLTNISKTIWPKKRRKNKQDSEKQQKSERKLGKMFPRSFQKPQYASVLNIFVHLTFQLCQIAPWIKAPKTVVCIFRKLYCFHEPNLLLRTRARQTSPKPAINYRLFFRLSNWKLLNCLNYLPSSSRFLSIVRAGRGWRDDRWYDVGAQVSRGDRQRPGRDSYVPY